MLNSLGIKDDKTEDMIEFLKGPSKGNLENPKDLYKKFRGREPELNALLERDGLLK